MTENKNLHIRHQPQFFHLYLEQLLGTPWQILIEIVLKYVTSTQYSLYSFCNQISYSPFGWLFTLPSTTLWFSLIQSVIYLFLKELREGSSIIHSFLTSFTKPISFVCLEHHTSLQFSHYFIRAWKSIFFL